MTFMHEEVGRKEFEKGLPKRVKLGLNLNETLLSTGFYAWGGFNTLGISVKVRLTCRFLMRCLNS